MQRPGERHLYKSCPFNKMSKNTQCLTCAKKKLSKETQNLSPTCDYSSVKFSPGGSYYLLDCLDGGGGKKIFYNVNFS